MKRSLGVHVPSCVCVCLLVCASINGWLFVSFGMHTAYTSKQTQIIIIIFKLKYIAFIRNASQTDLTCLVNVDLWLGVELCHPSLPFSLARSRSLWVYKRCVCNAAGSKHPVSFNHFLSMPKVLRIALFHFSSSLAAAFKSDSFRSFSCIFYI